MLELDVIHTRIREAREKTGLSQEAMAAQIGVGRTTYINFETGRTKLYCRSLLRMAKFLDITEEELLFGPRPDEGLLRDQLTLDNWKKQVVDDYENRLAALREQLDAADKEIVEKDKTLDSLRNTNKFLLEELGKQR